MEKQIKRIPWIGNIIQKFEDMCLEVDEVMRQNALKNVENQLQRVQNVLPPSSVDIEKEEVSDSSVAGNADGTTYEKSGVGTDEKKFKEGLCKVDHLLHSSSVEPIKGIGSSLEERVDIGTNVKLESSIKKYPIKKKK